MSGKIKTAMVMAAGHGTRMRPLTNHLSKAMVEVGGKPLIDHMLDRLEAAGVERAVVNVHAHADHLEAHLKRRKSGPEIIISDERDELLETGGGVVKALPLLGDDPFLICNIDAVWVARINVLANLMAQWSRLKNAKSLLMLASTDQAFGFNGFGDFILDRRGRLSMRKEAYAPYVYAGVEITRPENFKGFSIEKFSRLRVWGAEMSGIYGHVMSAHWLHIGDPQALELAEKILAEPRGKA